MKYREYEDDYLRCPVCGSYIDSWAMLCKKCGYDFMKEGGNVKSPRTKVGKSNKEY